MIQKIQSQFYEVKEQVVDMAILALSIMAMTIAVLGIVRGLRFGFNPSDVLVPFIVVIFVITYIMRKKLTYGVKSLILFVLLYVVIVATGISFGMISQSASVIIVTITLSSLLVSKGTRNIFIAVGILTFLIIGLLYVLRILEYSVDLNTYAYDFQAWIMNLNALIALSLITGLSTNWIMNSYRRNMVEAIYHKEQYESLVNGLPDALFTVDHDNGMVQINAGTYELFKCLEKDLKGKNVFELYEKRLSIGQIQLQYLESKIAAVRADDKIEHLQLTYEWQEKVYYLETLIIPLHTDQDEVGQVIISHRDATDKIMAQQRVEALLKSEKVALEKAVEERTLELESTMKELMNSERLASLGALVAGVAHEINTPLGVAVSASSYLVEKNEKAYQALTSGDLTKSKLIKYMQIVDETSEIIEVNLERAASLVKSFKEISVSQSHDLLTDFDLRDYIQSIILTLKHEYKNTKHRIECLYQDELWIKSYPSAFSQIITNLIMNALIHGFDDDMEGRISIMLEKSDNLIIRFKDNGKGISKENLSKLFDPFFTTNRGNGGSGLGMSIVYNIVNDRLNGSIKVETEEGKGTEFIITVPMECLDQSKAFKTPMDT